MFLISLILAVIVGVAVVDVVRDYFLPTLHENIKEKVKQMEREREISQQETLNELKEYIKNKKDK